MAKEKKKIDDSEYDEFSLKSYSFNKKYFYFFFFVCPHCEVYKEKELFKTFIQIYQSYQIFLNASLWLTFA